jgi:hypothetical protein
LETIHDTGATRLYHGQVVWLEWQSWHERSRIAPTWGLIACDMRTPEVAEALGVMGIENNCIPRKTTPNEIEVTFASLRIKFHFVCGLIFFLAI